MSRMKMSLRTLYCKIEKVAGDVHLCFLGTGLNYLNENKLTIPISAVTIYVLFQESRSVCDHRLQILKIFVKCYWISRIHFRYKVFISHEL